MALQLSRRFRILALVMAGLILVYAALGFWLAPRILRSQIEDFSLQHWQRKPTLGAISFNPFRLSLEVENFAFQDSRAQPLLSFARLQVNLDISSLWRRGLSFHEIELDRPVFQVLVRNDGSLNLEELSAPFAAAEADSADSKPLRLFIDRFQLREGEFQFEDQARTTPFKARLTPVNFELLDFDTTRRGEGGDGNNYLLQAMSTAGEKFRWSGHFGMMPLSSRGEFELTQVQARTLWSYLQESLGFEVSAGLVGIAGDYEFAATEPDLTLRIGLARLGVDGLKLRPRGGDSDWVQLDQLAVGRATFDLTKRLIDVASVKLDAGTLQLQRAANGSLNLLALFEAPAASAAPAPVMIEASGSSTEEPGGAWTVNIPEIAIDNLNVEARDEFVKPAASFTLSPVTLQVRGFTTRPGQALDVVGAITLASGGRLDIDGKATPAANTFAGRARLKDLDLKAFQPYLGAYMQMTLLSGLLDTDLEMDVAPGATRIAGTVASSRLHTVDNALREDFIKWDRLSLNGLEYRQGKGPGSLRIDDIAARSPYVRFIIAQDQTTNVAKVLTPPADAPGPVQTLRESDAPATGVQQPMAMNLGRIRIENGSANFADFWITPNYAVSLQQLSGTLSGLSSRKDSRARLALKGRIDRYAPAEISGELNLLSASLFTDLRVKFDGVELTSVTPYSGRFAGYRIEKGKLSVDVRYKVENRKLDAEQRFVIDQLSLGERVDSPDAVKLPLGLAVALLKDRNGVIDLGLPVTGSLDDPKFRIGPIVWKAFVNLLGGIATSPFKLLGGMFGGGDEVNLIEFDAGSATLDAAATEKLKSLANAMRERPQLALEVPAVFAPDADAAVLAAGQLDARLHSQAQSRKQPESALADPAQRFDLLLAIYKNDRPDAALPPAAQALSSLRARDRDAAALAAANTELESALRPGLDALNAQLQALAQQRASAIQDALLSSGEVDPGRVFLVAPAASPAANGRARLALGLR